MPVGTMELVDYSESNDCTVSGASCGTSRQYAPWRKSGKLRFMLPVATRESESRTSDWCLILQEEFDVAGITATPILVVDTDGSDGVCDLTEDAFQIFQRQYNLMHDNSDSDSDASASASDETGPGLFVAHHARLCDAQHDPTYALNHLMALIRDREMRQCDVCKIVDTVDVVSRSTVCSYCETRILHCPGCDCCVEGMTDVACCLDCAAAKAGDDDDDDEEDTV